MSKITIANRKFLEKQVANIINEIGPQDVGVGSYRPEPGERKVIAKLLGGVGDELMDPVLYLYRWLDRKVQHSGSFYLQALRNLNPASQLVKTFFSMYRPTSSGNFLSTMDIAGIESIFDPKGYKIHDDLKQRINTHLKDKDPYNLYKSLFNYFKSTNTQDLILSSNQVVKKAFSDYRKDKDFDKFVFSLFRRAKDAPTEGKSIFDFLEEDKEDLLFQLKQQNNGVDFYVFLVASEIDSSGVSDLKKYAKEISSMAQREENLNPINIVRGIGQISAGYSLEKAIEKRLKKPMGLMTGLAVSLAISLSLDAVDEFVSVPGTSKFDYDKVSGLIQQAIDMIKEIGPKREMTSQEEQEVKNLINNAAMIIRKQFKKHMESEGFKMNISERVAAFDQFVKALQRARDKFDTSEFSINQNTWKKASQGLEDFKKEMQNMYSKYKTSLSSLSPLQEDAAEDRRREKEERRKQEQSLVTLENGIQIKQKQLNAAQEAGIKEEDINKIIKIYKLTPQNVDRKFNSVSKLPEFIRKSVRLGENRRSDFALQFRQAWKDNTRTLKSAYQENPDAEPTFLRNGYERMGLLHNLQGKNGLFSELTTLDLILCPLLYRFESSTFLMSSTKRSVLFETALDVSKKGGSTLNNNKRASFVLNKLNPQINVTEGLADKMRNSKVSGPLAQIFALHINTLENLNHVTQGFALSAAGVADKIEQYGNMVDENSSFQEVIEAVKNIQKAAMMVFSWFYTLGDVETFLKDNQISFILEE